MAKTITRSGWYAIKPPGVDTWLIAHLSARSRPARGVTVLGPADSAIEAAGLTPVDERPVRFDSGGRLKNDRQTRLARGKAAERRRLRTSQEGRAAL